MVSYYDQLTRIAEKLPLARQRDPQLEAFCAAAHKYQVHPVPAAEVEAFEQACGVRLPEDYRQFLLHIGYGAGPDYGISRPSLSMERFQFCNPQRCLAQPYAAWPGITAEEWEAVREDLAAAGQDEDAGVLVLGEVGCGSFHGLVVSGPQRGRVLTMHFAQDDTPDFSRENNFLDWYEDWLDRRLPGYDVSMKAARFYRSTDVETWKLDCLRDLRADNLDLLLQECHNPNPRLSMEALRRLTIVDYAQALPLLRARWHTQPLAVYGALWCHRHADDWHAELAHTLADPTLNASLMQFACNVLRESSTDLSGLVEPLLQHPDPGIRHEAEYVLWTRDKQRAAAAGPSPEPDSRATQG